MKKLISCFVLSAMICSLASCGSDTGSSSENAAESSSSEAVESAVEEAAEEAEDNAESAAESAAEEAEAEAVAEADEEEDTPVAVNTDDIEFEDAVVAESGDAYLAIVDGQWWVQYWGGNDESNLLTYNAGVVPITGNGDYTVSVTADTNGFRYDTTGDVNDYGATPSGLSFMAVMIKDGETAVPGAVITVNSITIDGTKDVPLSAKQYTSSDDGKETRTNLYNEWVSQPSADARSVDGNLYEADGETPTPACADYSAQVVDPAAFADGWTSVEVNFTISGLE
ncbi:MAG: hypothetical protein IJ874_08450 [Ruminococcus sp.]|nr:hypothetical protein [Ruminococcus sp.]